MPNTVSLSEVVNGAIERKTRAEKVAWLRKHNCLALRDILKIMYDPAIELLLPAEEPPYKPSDAPDTHGMLYQECRKLKHFVKGYSGNLTQLKREQIFIQILESIDRKDAELLIKMIKQEPLVGLPPRVINEAFGIDLVPIPETKGKKAEDV